MLAAPEDALELEVEIAVVAPAVDDPAKVAMPNNAAAFGMLPSVGAVAAVDDPVRYIKQGGRSNVVPTQLLMFAWWIIFTLE